MRISSLTPSLIICLGFTLGGCGFTCDEDSKGVRYARSLSEERLAKLYFDMEKLSSDNSVPDSGYSSWDENRAFPEQFSDLQVVRVRPHYANIMVEGCFDHYVYMNFEGYGRLKEYYPQRRIVLSWGEHETKGSEVLWQETTSTQPK